MRQPIAIIRGTTKLVNIDLTSQVTGQNYVLSDNEFIRFGVKKRPTDSKYVIKKTLTSANYENGTYVLMLSPSDTESLDFGCYWYDVGVQSGVEYFNIIECSEFDIRYNVTSRGMSSVGETPSTGSGLSMTTEQINALDGLFKVCAFTKADVSAEYSAFCTAFGITDSGDSGGDSGGTEEPDEPVTPEVTLTSISAVYSGGNVPVGTAVTDLTGIAVTAHYSDGSTAPVAGYTLTGTIVEGSNTVTVSYQGVTTTFIVTGVAVESGGDESATNGWEDGVPYDLSNYTEGQYVSNTTGETINYNGYGVTDYLPCKGASTITLDSDVYWDNYNVFYDENKVFIKNFPLSTTAPSANVPSNAWYIRLSSKTANFAKAVITPHA